MINANIFFIRKNSILGKVTLINVLYFALYVLYYLLLLHIQITIRPKLVIFCLFGYLLNSTNNHRI
jgi:hypothetical protein